jgi:phospho-N-acetylmuramoyl-pentapeptide-transferase
MIYYIAKTLQSKYTFFNIFHYVSVRATCSFLVSLFLVLVFGNYFINILSKNFCSKVRDWTPKRHQKKNNTPTMGGLFVIAISILNIILWCNLSKKIIWIFLLGIISFGSIGFLDDWLKIKNNNGVSASLKFLLQIICAHIVTLLWYFSSCKTTILCVPFFKNFMPDLSWFIIFWAAFVIVATSNAVNLTDGLDGLATGPLIFNFATFSIIAYLAGHKSFSSYLYIPFAHSGELAVVGATLVGALLGFLWYNTYPAQIFMGDVGSIAFGAGLALMALMSRQELLLIISGGLFLIETASVIIQVVSFKLRKKRIFLMAPIHHHFELKGWEESKITVRFWIVSIILSVITMLTLKIR